jgi:hypothetical protein
MILLYMRISIITAPNRCNPSQILPRDAISARAEMKSGATRMTDILFHQYHRGFYREFRCQVSSHRSGSDSNFCRSALSACFESIYYIYTNGPGCVKALIALDLPVPTLAACFLRWAMSDSSAASKCRRSESPKCVKRLSSCESFYFCIFGGS